MGASRRTNRLLRSSRSSWERFGRDDALWAVLTGPAVRHGGWDLDAFLETGRDDVAKMRSRFAALGLAPRTRRALDFGCGVGRLSQALAEHYDEVHGVDASSSMIDEANHLNRWPDRCRFVQNTGTGFQGFETGSYDLVLSLIAIQHIPRKVARTYLEAMPALLAPGGVTFLHIPDRRSPGMKGWWLRNRALRIRQRVTGRPGMEMNPWSRREVQDILEGGGLRVLDDAGRVYVAQRPEGDEVGQSPPTTVE